MPGWSLTTWAFRLNICSITQHMTHMILQYVAFLWEWHSRTNIEITRGDAASLITNNVLVIEYNNKNILLIYGRRWTKINNRGRQRTSFQIMVQLTTLRRTKYRSTSFLSYVNQCSTLIGLLIYSSCDLHCKHSLLALGQSIHWIDRVSTLYITFTHIIVALYQNGPVVLPIVCYQAIHLQALLSRVAYIINHTWLIHWYSYICTETRQRIFNALPINPIHFPPAICVRSVSMVTFWIYVCWCLWGITGKCNTWKHIKYRSHMSPVPV